MKLPKRDATAEIPTSSMADIAFLLIVFFMLTTVFSANAGMEHRLPSESVLTGTPEEAIFIKIFPSGDFEMDGTSFTQAQVGEVGPYVTSKVSVNMQKPIILHTDREAKYGDMVAILDQLKSAEQSLGQKLSLTIPTKEEQARYLEYLK